MVQEHKIMRMKLKYARSFKEIKKSMNKGKIIMDKIYYLLKLRLPIIMSQSLKKMKLRIF